MNGWNKWGIRRKLFSVILFILAFNIVVLVLMGSTLFAHFYQSNKVAELKNSAKQIRAAYEQNSETVYEEISLIENRNAQVSLFGIEADGTLTGVYLSRKGGDDPHKGLPPPPDDDVRVKRFTEEMLERLRNTGEGFNIQTGSQGEDAWRDTITLSTRLSEDLYLYMQTPRNYIKSTADLAVKYTAFLSIAILLVGSIAVYFVVGRITKPIQRMQAVADRISRMDFTQKCEVTGKDEISMLGTSINNMSVALQSSIETLVEANAVLQNDLVRQQQTDRMRQQFMANVSHDFKTPLTLMISYAEALTEQNPNGTGAEYCEIIISEGNKLSRMVGRLLNLSKLESGVDKAEEGIFCLSEVIDEVIKNQRILTDKQDVSVARQYEDAFIVVADYQKIEQVVTNLYENAVKYTPKGGSIKAITEARDGKCRVSIENTGDAINEEDMSSLFESFYRADKSRSAGQSYGLGLAIVKVVMEAHHQAYGVENIEGGVRFWFELTLAEFDEEETDE